MSEAIRSVIESVDSLEAIVDENEGSILSECLVGDYKLSMWIPGDSGKQYSLRSSLVGIYNVLNLFSWSCCWQKGGSDHKFANRNEI